MENQQLITEIQSLINQHLVGWSFKVTKTKHAMGQCDHINKEITISIYHLTTGTLEEIKDTILHEIAHAMTPGHNHDRIWKLKCIELGARPATKANRIASTKFVESIPPKHSYVCKICGHAKYSNRKLKHRYSCTKCGQALGTVRFNPGLELEHKPLR